MTRLTPEVAEKLAESWALYPDYRARLGNKLHDYLDQFADADERNAERVYLVEIAAYFTSADELAEDRDNRIVNSVTTRQKWKAEQGNK